ncbi:MAG: Mov34/MPN/PAD-1 family protein, partial [Hydrogenophilus sp.]|nr:Mov34/MPN/PAD-1 family protein [Hydrogenophilus sp.]
MDQVDLRLPQGLFANLRARLLADLGQEHFALLLGQAEQVGEYLVIKVVEARYPGPDDYESQGPAHLRLRREYVYDCLVEMQQRGNLNALIDVHTHPFALRGAAFSGLDDRDEMAFYRWLDETLDGMYYASIAFSQSDYA